MKSRLYVFDKTLSEGQALNQLKKLLLLAGHRVCEANEEMVKKFRSVQEAEKAIRQAWLQGGRSSIRFVKIHIYTELQWDSHSDIDASTIDYPEILEGLSDLSDITRHKAEKWVADLMNIGLLI